MSFNLRELSRWSGKPVGLLAISRGALVERYTNADRPVTAGGHTYIPLAVTRSAIRDSAERAKNRVTLTLPIDAPVVAWWRPFPPSTPVAVTWLSMHHGDADTVVEWQGRVIGPKFSDTQLTLECEPSKSSAASRGLALRWQRGCPLALYSQGLGMCNVDKAEHALPAVLTAVAGSGITLTAAEFATLPVGRLAGGFIEWTRPDGEPEYRGIMAHTGDTIVVNYGADTLEDGTAVTAYPGCAHNFGDCGGYFDNAPNYGGSLFLPVRSPFNGNPL